MNLDLVAWILVLVVALVGLLWRDARLYALELAIALIVLLVRYVVHRG